MSKQLIEAYNKKAQEYIANLGKLFAYLKNLEDNSKLLPKFYKEKTGFLRNRAICPLCKSPKVTYKVIDLNIPKTIPKLSYLRSRWHYLKCLNCDYEKGDKEIGMIEYRTVYSPYHPY